MLTGDEYEMLCRAAFKLGIARSAWVRERVYALLCRSYADEHITAEQSVVSSGIFYRW